MSDLLEEFVTRFESLTLAARLRAMALILAEKDSDPPLDVDPDESATKAGISPEQRERFQRAIDEAITYRAAQND